MHACCFITHMITMLLAENSGGRIKGKCLATPGKVSGQAAHGPIRSGADGRYRNLESLSATLLLHHGRFATSNTVKILKG